MVEHYVIRHRTPAFFLAMAAIALLSWRFLHETISGSLQNGYSSQSVLVPFISAYLVSLVWKKILAEPCQSSMYAGAAVILGGLFGFYLGKVYAGPAQVFDSPAVKFAGVILMLAGAFIGAYGVRAFRAVLFPFFLLLFMLPLPAAAADKVVGFLQTQSAALSFHLFSLCGVPVFREGVRLSVPGVTIEVAKECSGINSSVALLLTALLVAQQTLRTTSRRIVLVLLTIPLSILKNAVRIVTLTLLAVYADPGFLTGRLHHQGGFVFFLISLVLVYPIWRLLKRSERSDSAKNAGRLGSAALSSGD